MVAAAAQLSESSGNVVGSEAAGGKLVPARYFLGNTASFNCLAILAFTTVFAGILIASPVAGLRPIRALRFCTTSFTIPGSTNSPARLSSFSDNAVN